MSLRTRKFVGAIALFVLIAVYSLLAMFVAIALQVNASRFAELAYYVIAGLAWVIPAAFIVKWMSPREGEQVPPVN